MHLTSLIMLHTRAGYLDAAISSRASQASINSITASLGNPTIDGNKIDGFYFMDVVTEVISSKDWTKAYSCTGKGILLSGYHLDTNPQRNHYTRWIIDGNNIIDLSNYSYSGSIQFDFPEGLLISFNSSFQVEWKRASNIATLYPSKFEYYYLKFK